MWEQIWPGLRMKLLMTLALGVVYPLVVTGLCQVLFPHQANGSLVRQGGQVVGSELIGQNFKGPRYFHPRPSAAGNDGYDATASGGSNFGPTNKKLADRVSAGLEAFHKENPQYRGPIPADLLTASGSGLDPHISPDSARAQVARVAGARQVSAEAIGRLLAAAIEQPDLGVLGERRVNVLRLNLMLDHQYPGR